jgi:hypothetical protein
MDTRGLGIPEYRAACRPPLVRPGRLPGSGTSRTGLYRYTDARRLITPDAVGHNVRIGTSGPSSSIGRLRRWLLLLDTSVDPQPMLTTDQLRKLLNS